MSKIEELAESLKKKHIVFFGGAGVSTESNIPDFRSSDGLYQKKTYKYPAERMLSHSMYEYDPKAFYDFYFNEMIYPNAMPNAAHEVLAKLETMGNLDAISPKISMGCIRRLVLSVCMSCMAACTAIHVSNAALIIH